MRRCGRCASTSSASSAGSCTTRSTYQNEIFDAMMEAGEEFDIKPFGIRAMDSLRIEKSYQILARRPLHREHGLRSPASTASSISTRASSSAARRWCASSSRACRASSSPSKCDAKDSDPWGNEPLFIGKKMVGRTTSGAYGYAVGKSLAVGYVKIRCGAARHRTQDPDARQETHRPHRRGFAVGSGECSVAGVTILQHRRTSSVGAGLKPVPTLLPSHKLPTD